MVTQIPNLCGFITYIIRTSLFDETFNSIIFYYIDIILTNATFNQITYVAKLSKIIHPVIHLYIHKTCCIFSTKLVHNMLMQSWFSIN